LRDAKTLESWFNRVGMAVRYRDGATHRPTADHALFGIVSRTPIVYVEDMSAPLPNPWVFLAPKPRSQYEQLFVKERNIAAWTLYSMSVGNEQEPGLTPEAIAADYDLPIDAVREAIRYCESNPPEIRADWEADEALAATTGMNDPRRLPPRILSPQEIAQLRRP
jgi:uncharacterized protein (DUF433 family)